MQTLQTVGKATNRVRDFRVRKLLTQEMLAERAGVSWFTIQRAEKGIRVSLLSQERIARALEVPRDVLFPQPPEPAAGEATG